MVLHAESGVGKTSVMAKVYKLIPEWFGEVSDQCIRFTLYFHPSDTVPGNCHISNYENALCVSFSGIY